jgi:hypothetical protein
MAFAGIFQPFARLRWIRFGLLMRDAKFSRRLSVPQTTALAPVPFAPDDYVGRVLAFLAITVPGEDSNIDTKRWRRLRVSRLRAAVRKFSLVSIKSEDPTLFPFIHARLL